MASATIGPVGLRPTSGGGTLAGRLIDALGAVPPPPLGGVLALLDRLRSQVLRALAPRARSLVVDRDLRVAAVGSCLVLTALLGASALPIIALAVGPLVWGVPHIVSDLRYLVSRPGFHRRPWALAAMLAGIVAAGMGYGVRGGLVGAAASLLVARASPRRRVLGLAIVGALFALAQWAGPLSDLVFAHGHNAVALALWWAWRPRRSALHWIPLALFGAGCALVLTGALAPIAEHTGGFIAPWTRLTPRMLTPGLSPWAFGPMARRLLVLYAFAQSVHYLVWLRLVPEDDRPSPTPRSFLQSYRALRSDVGSLVIWLAVLVALALAVWATIDVGRARNGYIQLVFFHGYLELAAGALLWAERGWRRGDDLRIDALRSDALRSDALRSDALRSDTPSNDGLPQGETARKA